MLIPLTLCIAGVRQKASIHRWVPALTGGTSAHPVSHRGHRSYDRVPSTSQGETRPPERSDWFLSGDGFFERCSGGNTMVGKPVRDTSVVMAQMMIPQDANPSVQPGVSPLQPPRLIATAG